MGAARPVAPPDPEVPPLDEELSFAHAAPMRANTITKGANNRVGTSASFLLPGEA